MKPPHPEDDNIKLDQMTRQDLKKIEKSMKRPEFLGLLNEYMVEISDPKNKNQYDEYLRQMERQKQLPKHMKIVEVRPKFCFRTFIVSAKNKKHEMKFFVNMCESEYLQKPGCEPAPTADGKVGYNWKIPNSMGKIRYDQDKGGNPCQVVDIAFHPDTYMFATKKQFQQMLVNIALQAAERQLGQRKQTLSRDYVILKNVKCKGQDGKPALMPIRYIEGKMYNKGEGPNNQIQRATQGKETKLQKELNQQKAQHQKEKEEEKNNKQKQEDQNKEEDQLDDKPKLVVDLQQGVQRPKYSTIYTYPVEYSEFIDSPYMNKRKIPTVFNIQFAIPRVESMEEIANQTLEINDKKILLKIGQKYFIDLDLEDLKVKYVLQTSSARAKYDKKKKCLRIIIPVDQSVQYQIQKVGEEPKAEDVKVVQEQTWKNKILEVKQPDVSVKMLEPTDEAAEEKPTLVEEIDDEDIVEPPKPEKATAAGALDDDIQEEPEKPAEKKFSISSYYNKPKKDESKNSQESKRIGFLFQETADKIVLVLQMKNYNKDDISFLNIENREICVIWNNAQNKKYEHLRLQDKFVPKVEKVDSVFRVGFLAIMILKKSKGEYWQKQAIDQIIHEGQNEDERLRHFQTYFRSKKAEDEQRQRELDEAKAKQEEQRQKQQVEAQEKALRQAPDSKQFKVESMTQQKTSSLPSQSVSVSSQSLFLNLQPQFIAFNCDFVLALD